MAVSTPVSLLCLCGQVTGWLESIGTCWIYKCMFKPKLWFMCWMFPEHPRTLPGHYAACIGPKLKANILQQKKQVWMWMEICVLMNVLNRKELNIKSGRKKPVFTTISLLYPLPCLPHQKVCLQNWPLVTSQGAAIADWDWNNMGL